MKNLWSGLIIVCLTFCLYGLAQAKDKSLVLYFNFEGGAGNAVKGRSNLRNDGTIRRNVEWVDGKIGQGMRLTGEGFVLVSDADEFQDPKELTIMVWVKPEETDNHKQFLLLEFLVCRWWFEEEPPNYNYELGFANGVPRFWYSTPPGDNDMHTSVKMKAERAAKFGKWIYIVGVFDGLEAILYVDGRKAGANRFKGPLHNGTTPLVIGDNNEGLADDWRLVGVIDEVAAYRRALSQVEIQKRWSYTKFS